MPREFPRSRRLEEAIQRTLSEMLAGKVRDPRLSDVVITDVQVTKDLSLARVYYALLSGAEPSGDLSDALSAAAGFLRSGLAAGLRVRRVPELRFLVDEALARGRALERLIDSTRKDSPAETLRGQPPAEPDGH